MFFSRTGGGMPTDVTQYDYVELTRELKIPDDDDVDESMSMSMRSMPEHASSSHHEKNQSSVDSAR
jgi:Amt family ammonium transporter